MNDRYTNRDDFDNLLDRVEKLEKNHENLKEFAESTDNQAKINKDDIEELRKLLKDLQDKLNNKVDSDVFDEELNNLKNLINSMGGSGTGAPVVSGPSISTKELNRLKELTNKIPELEDMLNKIMKDLKGLNLGELKDKLRELEKLINEKADKVTVDAALADLLSRVANLEKDVDWLKNN